MDETLNYPRLAHDAKQLFNAGYSTADIGKVFNRKGAWYKKHWKGKKGQKPNTNDIRSSIKELLGKDRDKYIEGEFSEFIEK
jgi:hypothetical protein